MNEVRLQKTLWLAGWATLIGYFIGIFTNNLIRQARAKELGVSEELLVETSNIYLLGALFESPLHLPTGLLCLFAAFYLKHKPKPISETFE